ncbi:AlpA family transcriptional regulator [Aquabacterium sp. J223]|uniref:helix-turn-helix transcriptional regulator n=1 Tax=Aquabacterium sp. J223 TaxID=2898431 RepID=UPI0021FD8A02|nr:AlpA family phage regulatory protein [Aquabacterium sp. J223]UUX96629.1 AlpA family phage regulatory protein [Aquabacterium sp. J223]
MRRAIAPSTASVLEVHDAEFLRMPSVVRRTGLGRSTIYRLVAERKFPSPVKLAARAVAWRRSDLDRWSESRSSVED